MNLSIEALKFEQRKANRNRIMRIVTPHARPISFKQLGIWAAIEAQCEVANDESEQYCDREPHA